MLARPFRLKKRDIDRVYKKGQRRNYNFLLARFVFNSAKTSRFAVVIPKAVVKKSVDRSRLKRKTHEALQANFTLPKQNYDVVLSFRKIPEEAVIAPTILEILKNLD